MTVFLRNVISAAKLCLALCSIDRGAQNGTEKPWQRSLSFLRRGSSRRQRPPQPPPLPPAAPPPAEKSPAPAQVCCRVAFPRAVPARLARRVPPTNPPVACARTCTNKHLHAFSVSCGLAAGGSIWVLTPAAPRCSRCSQRRPQRKTRSRRLVSVGRPRPSTDDVGLRALAWMPRTRALIGRARR